MARIVRLLETIKVLSLLHDVVLYQILASLYLLLQSRGPFINFDFSCLLGWLGRASLKTIRLQHLDFFVRLNDLLKRLSIVLKCLNSYYVYSNLRVFLIFLARLI